MFIANIAFFHSTASHSAWYEKRIKIFLSTWNQIRVSLAITGEPTTSYSGENKSVCEPFEKNWISALTTHKMCSDLHPSHSCRQTQSDPKFCFSKLY